MSLDAEKYVNLMKNSLSRHFGEFLLEESNTFFKGGKVKVRHI